MYEYIHSITSCNEDRVAQSVQRLATGWMVRGSNPSGGKIFRTCALRPTQPPVQWIPGLSRGKQRPGREADPSPPSNAVIKKGQSYTCTTPTGRTACTEPQCLYKGALYLFTPCNIQQSMFHWFPPSSIGMFHKYTKWSAVDSVDTCGEKTIFNF